MEASESQRTEYCKLIKDLDNQTIVYVDESGIELNSVKDRGWGKKGMVLRGKKSGKYYQRTNIISGLVNNKPIAPMVFNGSCDTNLFESWVAEFLTKELMPGQIVVMDNATFHKSNKTRELIEAKGCTVVFLPPYSPDLNPIEKFWANMKRWLREQIDKFHNLFLALSAFFLSPNLT